MKNLRVLLENIVEQHRLNDGVVDEIYIDQAIAEIEKMIPEKKEIVPIIKGSTLTQNIIEQGHNECVDQIRTNMGLS